MIKMKLIFEAGDLYNKLKRLFWETNRLEESGKDILLVDRAQARYRRRIRKFVVAINEKRKAEEIQPF